MIKRLLAVLVLLTTCSIANATPVVQFSDFIADGSRSNFNGFENIPNDGLFFTGGNGPYVEDGISVKQVNGNDKIYVTMELHQGNFIWYPNAGDHGYTEITRSGAVDFGNAGMTIQSGFNAATPRSTFYELLNDGATVLAGSYISANGQYLGFSGGGFDTIRLSNCLDCDPFSTTITDGHFQALAVDSIEISAVPEPETYAMFMAGLGLMGFIARRSKNSKA